MGAKNPATSRSTTNPRSTCAILAQFPQAKMAFASAFTTRKRKSKDEEGKEDDDDEGGDDKAPVAKAARIKVTTATAAKPPPKPAQRQPASRREEAATPPPPAIDTVRQSVSDALKELLPLFFRDFTPARVHSPESSPIYHRGDFREQCSPILLRCRLRTYRSSFMKREAQ